MSQTQPHPAFPNSCVPKLLPLLSHLPSWLVLLKSFGAPSFPLFFSTVLQVLPTLANQNIFT